MTKILIAMDASEQKEQLEQQLAGTYHVLSCDNGLDALNVIRTFCPDVIVLDLMLTGMDGVSLLEHAWNGGFRPKIIALTPCTSTYIVNALERMNICSLIRGVWDVSQLVARIIDVAQNENELQGMSTASVLASLGFKLNTSGCRITLLALEMFEKNPAQKITCELYPAVAVACGGTSSQVEKAIRDSIDSAWKDCNEQIWKMYFPVGKNGKTAKPTNGDFLARISRCVMENKKVSNKKIG